MKLKIIQISKRSTYSYPTKKYLNLLSNIHVQAG